MMYLLGLSEQEEFVNKGSSYLIAVPSKSNIDLEFFGVVIFAVIFFLLLFYIAHLLGKFQRVNKEGTADNLPPHERYIYNLLENELDKYSIEKDIDKTRMLDELHSLKSNITNRNYDLDRRFADLIIKQTEIEEAKFSTYRTTQSVMAEIRHLDGKTKLLDGHYRILDKIVNELDINNINSSQAFVLVKALNPMSNDNINILTQEALIKEQIEKMRVENDLTRSTVEDKKLETEYKKWKQEQAKKDIG